MAVAKKVVIICVSTVVLVGVALAVIGIMFWSGGPHPNGKDPTSINPNENAIQKFCDVTDYEETCVRSISSVIPNGSHPDPNDIVKASIKVTIDAIQLASANAKGIGNHTKDSKMQQALEICHELLQDSIDELKQSLDVASINNDTNDINKVKIRGDDLKNWLSAVITYQQTCLDGLENTNLKSAMKSNLANSNELTSNALAIVTEVMNFLRDLEIESTSRRLLISGATTSGYPEWFSAVDRRLLRAANAGKVKPNVVVAKDGSGNYKTITDAVNKIPENHRGRYVIYVKAGVYKENVLLDKKKENVFMYGDGPRKTVVTGSLNNVDGTPTFKTATFAVEGYGFICKWMGFTNTAGAAKHQAVALRVKADASAFYNCRMDAFQDTLYTHTHRQFYRNCVVSGTVDFIFGDASVVIQNTLIIVRRPMDGQKNTITAQGRSDKRQPTGIVIHNCKLVPDRKLFPDRFKIQTYLGRPWKQYSRTVIMESTLGDFIRPEGWLPWDGDFALNTLYYREYANRGPGAPTSRRVTWPGFGVIAQRSEALKFTVNNFINGNLWIKYAGIPYIPQLRRL